MLEARNVKKWYKSGGRTVQALCDVTWRVEPGSCRGIVGESGCGKSTFCRLLSGIERADEGTILYKGQPVSEAVKGQGRHAIQMIFQNSLDASPLHFTAYCMIAEPLVNFFPQKQMGLSFLLEMGKRKKARVERVKELLAIVGIPESELYKYPYQFSGGQLQRVCIARALAAQPELLLLDEPLSSLDVSVQAQILNLLSDLKRELKLTMVLVSHDLEAIYYLSDALTVMYGGRLMEEIDDIRMFGSLCHPYTLRLLASCGAAGRAAGKGVRQERVAEQVECRSMSEPGAEQKAKQSMRPAAGDAAETELAAGQTAADFAAATAFGGCPYWTRCPYADEKCRSIVPECTEIEQGHRIWCHHAKAAAALPVR